MVCLLDSADAQPPGGGGGRRRGGGGGAGGQAAPQDIGAWLHVGEDGKIKVFTGKAEVGQNIRTSLSQAVAEELHVSPSSIQMVMADTQLTPFDMGTFGSRTTPDMSWRLRRAAAAAREALIDVAAEVWKTDRPLLSAANGAVVNSRTKDSLDYGKLATGRKLTRVITSNETTTSPEKWTIAGQSMAKVDGRSFVTGQHHYASDIGLPGMWFGKVLRPPTIGATFASMDPTAAKAMPDVVVVHDGDFVGVAAPTERQAATCAGRDQGGMETRSADLRQDVVRRPEKTLHWGQNAGGERGGEEARASPRVRSRRASLPRTSASSKRTQSPTSRMPRSSRARPWRIGKTASSPFGPARKDHLECAASSPRHFDSTTARCA